MKFKLLIVDDDPVNRFLLARMLQRMEPAEIFSANDGAQALEMLVTEGPFHLILLDLNMPVLDGYGFLKALEEQEAFLMLENKILVQSASLEQDYQEQLRIKNIRAKNVFGYLEKPFDFELLKETVLAAVR